VNVTVIICTYNRCRTLEKALASVAASALPESTKWEVLVVDNNSSDQTREVADSFCERYPGRFRYVFEPRQGKSYALNTGVQKAQGEILAFVDDDLTVDPDWLRSLTAALHGGEWSGAGGRTLLAGAFDPPKWMAMKGPYSLGGILAAQFDLGDRPCVLTRAPYGANMAFRKEMFLKYGLFRTDLGPSPDKLVPRPNEDTELGRRLLAAGEPLRYEPLAVAYHPVPTHRITRSYFLRWHFDWGRALVREWGRGRNVLEVIPRPYFSILSVLFKTMVPSIVQWISALDPQRRFYSKCRVFLAAGEITEFYRLAREKVADVKSLRSSLNLPS
jgi:glucosyl-dolichyl phosphate glucuronosyltransferase